MLAAAALLGTTPAPASAAPAPGAVTQCNGIDNGGGRAVECDVTIINYLDVQTNVSSSVIVARTCTAAAGAEPLCTVLPVTFPTATTAVDQCNGSGLGGGATVDCEVNVVNRIIGTTTPAPATINQCVGSGTGGGTEPTLNCSPLDTTTDATITQCNGSANGGGASLRVTCTVDPSTQSTVLPVKINQCNGSAAGGSLVTCNASLTHEFLPAGTPIPPAETNPATPAPSVPAETAAPTAPAAPPVVPSPSAAPTATAEVPSPLIPVASGQRVLAESGAPVQPALYAAGGAVLLGAVLFGGVLLRRRNAQS